MLKEIIEGKLLSLRAAHGIWPANSTGNEDILVFADEERTEPIAKFAWCLGTRAAMDAWGASRGEARRAC